MILSQMQSSIHPEIVPGNYLSQKHPLSSPIKTEEKNKILCYFDSYKLKFNCKHFKQVNVFQPSLISFNWKQESVTNNLLDQQIWEKLQQLLVWPNTLQR